LKNRTLAKYLSLLMSRNFSEQDICSFRKALNGYSRSSLNREDREKLLELFERRAPYRISREQTLKGIAWLQRYCFKLDGSPRKRKDSPFESAHLEVIRNFSRFEFVGLKDLRADNPYSLSLNFHQYIPIYRVIARDGSYFDYSPATWGEVVELSQVETAAEVQA
jgi:hypothetical protein